MIIRSGFKILGYDNQTGLSYPKILEPDQIIISQDLRTRPDYHIPRSYNQTGLSYPKILEPDWIIISQDLKTRPDYHIPRS
jgi:hypothetical protein